MTRVFRENQDEILACINPGRLTEVRGRRVKHVAEYDSLRERLAAMEYNYKAAEESRLKAESERDAALSALKYVTLDLQKEKERAQQLEKDKKAAVDGNNVSPQNQQVQLPLPHDP
jgi:uncharacterized protein (DUF3084 family)